MRTKDNLSAIGDAALLMQYLYLSPGHKIHFRNSINVPLTLTMRDDMQVMCRNENFPELPLTNFTSDMTLPACISLIDVLKELPAEEFPERFPNRWEEIRELTLAALYLNREKKY